MNNRLVLVGILLLLGVTLSGCVGVVGYGHGYYSYPYSYNYGYDGYSYRSNHHDWDDHYRHW